MAKALTMQSIMVLTSAFKVTSVSTSVPFQRSASVVTLYTVFSTMTWTLPRFSLPLAVLAHTVVGIRLSAMTSARKSETMRFFICCFLLVIFSVYVNAFRPCCREEEVGEAGLASPTLMES